jgi:hypothetical protein
MKFIEDKGFMGLSKEEKTITGKATAEVVVIGAGIIGATIATAFRNKGLSVLIIDNDDPESGTKPCGGLIKPSPLMGLANEQINASLDMLDSTFGLKKETMIIKPSGNLIKASVRGVNMDLIFSTVKSYGHVWKIETSPNKVYYIPKDTQHTVVVDTKIIVIAAGMGCQVLLPQLFRKDGLVAKRGFSFHFKGQVQEQFVKFWAPYKQITIHNTTYAGEKIIWAGDGSALTLPSWYDGRIDEAFTRVVNELPRKFKLLRTVRGLRSFHRNKKYKPCYLNKIDEGCWIATGSGKFGLISAGYSAVEILKDELG